MTFVIFGIKRMTKLTIISGEKVVMNRVTVKRRVTNPIRAGDVMVEFISFQGDSSGKEHIGISFEGKSPSLKSAFPLVRLRSECLTGGIWLWTL